MRCIGKDELQKKQKMTMTLVNYYFFFCSMENVLYGHTTFHLLLIYCSIQPETVELIRLLRIKYAFRR